jgi:hypothetical protein
LPARCSCKIPGDYTTQFPYDCQLGDVLRPSLIADGATILGRQLSIRERSFLDNPRTDPQILSSGAVVEVQDPAASRQRLQGAGAGAGADEQAQEGAAEEEEWLGGWTGPLQVGRHSSTWLRLALPARRTDVQLQGLLAQQQQRRLLHVPEPAQLFSHFQDPELQQVTAAALTRAPLRPR